MEPLKQVLDKQQCDKTKQVIKKLLSQIDEGKKGYIKMDVFCQILSLHKVILGQDSLAKLQRLCGVPGKLDCLNYRDALQRMTINGNIDEPLMKEWVVR